MTKRPVARLLELRQVLLTVAALAGLALGVLPTAAHAETGRWLHEDHEIVLGYGCTPFELEPFDARFNCPEGWRVHEAIDFDTPEGTRVYAGLPGTVLDVGGKERKDYGPNYVRMLLPDGRDLILGHLGSAVVRPGDGVSQGQLIGFTGILGVTNWPNLHFEVRPHDGSTYTSINPASYLTLRSAAPTASMAPASVTDNDEASAATPEAQKQPVAPGPVTTETGSDPAAVVAALGPLAPVGGGLALLITVIAWRRRQRSWRLYETLG